jgi:anti-sigma regulatory factor (Ser/Thr protein kinase)
VITGHGSPPAPFAPGAVLGIASDVLLDLELRLRPDSRSPAEARRTLEGLRTSIDDSVVDDAVLLVSEVVANSVQHAGLDATDSIQVRIRGTRSMLHVDVIDPGPGFEPDIRPRAGEHGWGLRLVDRLSTRWGVENGETTRVWFDLAGFQERPRG